MTWTTKKSIAIIAITVAVLCAVIIPTKNSRDSKNRGSTRSTSTAAANERVLSDMTSDFPSMVPSDAPSAVPSDYPSSAPSDIPSSVPSISPTSAPTRVPTSIPLSDYPSLVPFSWGTAEPTTERQQSASQRDRDHKRQVRALRQQQKAQKTQRKP
jgi:hypothetical protein